jgi:fucose permease
MGKSLLRIWIKVKQYPKIGLVVLAYIAFISLGMPDGLLGVAWPSVRASFSIPVDAVGLLLSATVAGYLTSSFLSGPLIARLGVGNVLAASCAMTGAGLIGYTLVPAWWMMVLLGVVAGLGAGAIDAGLNTYVAAYFGAGMMQWLHACYGIGVTLGPVIMTIALTAQNSWRVGYRVVGGFQLALAACFALTLPIWNQKEAPIGSEVPKRLTDYKTPLVKTMLQSRVWLSVLLFFLYTGSEVSLGTWAYTLLTESRGIHPQGAGLLVGSYWAFFTVGRILAGLYAKRVGVNRLVLGGLIAALLGAVLLWWNPANVANLIAVPLIGFAIAPIFPALVSGTSQRVGVHYAANTIGMQMAAGGLADIQAAFNNARIQENAQLGLNLTMLTLPSQANWGALGDGGKALWLINAERRDRGVLPLHGIESIVTSVAQYYAKYLLDNDLWGHYEDGLSPWERLDANLDIHVCHDFLNVAENITVFVTSGSSIPLPVERSLYMWMYEDAGSGWGHRHAILWYPYNDNSGPSGQEGFLGIGRASGGPYQGPFSQPWNFAELIVMNVFDPCATWDYGILPMDNWIFLPFVLRY